MHSLHCPHVRNILVLIASRLSSHSNNHKRIYKVSLFSRGLSFLFSPQFDTPQRRENCCGSRVNAPGASRAPPHKYLRYIYRVDFLLDYSSRSTPGKSIFMRRVGVPRCAISRTLKGKDYTGSSVNNDAHLLKKREYSRAGVSRLRKNKKYLELIPLLSSGNSHRNDAISYTRIRYDARLEF